MPCVLDEPSGRLKGAPLLSTRLRALAGIAPVGRSEHLTGPGRLADRPSRAHLLEVRGDVQNGGAVDRVEVGDVKVSAVGTEQAREADRELVGAAVVAVHEGAGHAAIGRRRAGCGRATGRLRGAPGGSAKSR